MALRLVLWPLTSQKWNPWEVLSCRGGTPAGQGCTFVEPLAPQSPVHSTRVSIYKTRTLFGGETGISFTYVLTLVVFQDAA